MILEGVGSDNLDGGSDSDLIVGGFDVEMDGDNTLLGGDGIDVLVGSGGAGEDILASGSLTTECFREVEPSGVVPDWQHWLISGDFTDRIADISGELGGAEFLDESFLLQSDGSTFLDDDAVDTLMGGADSDWFIYHFEQDVLLDFNRGDVDWEIAPD